MKRHYDRLETRSADERAAATAAILPAVIERALQAPAYAGSLAGIEPADIRSVEDLSALPILRKSEISAMQAETPPLGGLAPGGAGGFDWIFQSPGPIYEPGLAFGDWWRVGRFLFACGIGKGDIVQNCLSYHLTPAGLMFETGARAVGATTVPAGPGQTELQARAAAAIGVTAYAGTPDYLKVVLDRADELGLDLSRLVKAAVGGGALFPSLRAEYKARGIHCLQCYATAELGNIAYETIPDAGLIVDEGVIVEIVTPGTGDAVGDGRVGEVVVTLLNDDYPLIRFATGDLSALLPGVSECGRTNMRLAGWKGRADQTTKVKGMFVRPEQVADFVRRHAAVTRARIIVSREGEMDQMVLQVEPEAQDLPALEASAAEIFKLKSRVTANAHGALPDDGKVIEDLRSYD
ncbi:MAG: AMP-binding protein [Rhodobacteraceae bacterium]|nr:AMP-binding protein [Paracoccaceae bacterium]